MWNLKQTIIHPITYANKNLHHLQTAIPYGYTIVYHGSIQAKHLWIKFVYTLVFHPKPNPSWWFQAGSNILVKLDHLTTKMGCAWNHHPPSGYIPHIPHTKYRNWPKIHHQIWLKCMIDVSKYSHPLEHLGIKKPIPSFCTWNPSQQKLCAFVGHKHPPSARSVKESGGWNHYK